MAAAKSQQAVSSIVSSGVATDEVRSAPLRLSRADTYDDAVAAGYSATVGLMINTRSVAAGERIVSLILQAGGVLMQGPMFTLTDRANLQRAAERAAIEDAQASADNIASKLNKRIARTLRVHRGPNLVNAAISDVTAALLKDDPSLDPREVDVKSDVIVDFALTE